MSECSAKSIEESEMDKITTELAEWTCDQICIYPQKIHDEEMLANICCECALGSYICQILNLYNKLNDFEKSQIAVLLARISELEAQNGKDK